MYVYSNDHDDENYSHGSFFLKRGGHEPLKRSVPYYSDNRAVLSPTSTDVIIFTRALTPLYQFIPWCKMALSMKRIGRNERGTVQQADLLSTAHVRQSCNESCMYVQSQQWIMHVCTVTASKKKYHRINAIYSYAQSLKTSLLIRTAPHHANKSKEIATPIDKGGRQVRGPNVTWSLDSGGPCMGNYFFSFQIDAKVLFLVPIWR